MNGQPTLALNAVACERGGRALFRGLSLQLGAGQLLRVAGANGAGKTSLLRLMCGLLLPSEGEVRWRGQPGIYLLCLATGIRIGAGYVWSAYTGVFFSDLFETEDGSCTYSFNDQFAGALPSTVCDSDYPYCVSGTCSALNAYPWHNKVSF